METRCIEMVSKVKDDDDDDDDKTAQKTHTNQRRKIKLLKNIKIFLEKKER